MVCCIVMATIISYVLWLFRKIKSITRRRSAIIGVVSAFALLAGVVNHMAMRSEPVRFDTMAYLANVPICEPDLAKR